MINIKIMMVTVLQFTHISYLSIGSSGMSSIVWDSRLSIGGLDDNLKKNIIGISLTKKVLPFRFNIC